MRCTFDESSTPTAGMSIRENLIPWLGQNGRESARDNVDKLRAGEEVGKLFERSQRFVMEARDRPPSKEASA